MFINACSAKLIETLHMDIFISYKREYEDFAKRLYQSLVGWGHQPWLDVFHIPPGTAPETKGWDDAIHSAMKAARVVVGLLTPEALKSEAVLDEWGWALTNSRRLFLLWLRDIDEEEIPPRYIRIQRIDLRRNEENGLRRLHSALESPVLIIPPDTSKNLERYAVSPLNISVDRNRAKLAEKIEQFWIRGVLDRVVGDAQFELRVELKPDTVLKHKDYGDYELPTTGGIGEMFQEMGQELLILGAPGSGKTVLLLQLARALLQRSQGNPAQPIPTVFNLSSWSERLEPLEQWLIRELRVRYQVSRTLARRWLENQRLVLLLDGLDEVQIEHRSACVEAINDYRHTHRGTPIAVCSRLVDYEQLTTQFEIPSAIALQPLTNEQIDTYLESQSKLGGLRESLDRETSLREMASTPFLLNTMVAAYAEMEPHQIMTFATRTERRNHLFDHYLARQFMDDPRYTLAQTRRWLSWVASILTKRAQSVFYIEDLQPDILPDGNRTIVRLMSGASIGVTILTLLLMASLLASQQGLIVIALGIGLSITIFYTWNARIRSAASVRWTISRFGFLAGLPLGLLLGSVNAATTDISSLDERLVLCYQDLTRPVLVINLVVGLVLGLILSGLLSLLFGLRRQSVVMSKIQPNLGIRLSAYNAIRGGVILVLLLSGSLLAFFGMVEFVIPSLTLQLVRESCPFVSLRRSAEISLTLFSLIRDQSIINGLSTFLVSVPIVAATLGFFLAGGATVIQHIVLRLALSSIAKAPLDLARFLNFATDRGLLQHVGSGYLFRHRMLLEYMAEFSSAPNSQKGESSE
ncbi:MAG: TIR domain-containing protein [Anaerolineae bacterium]|nr:TIR domain-containing protein [Anaerolineae bacterium]